MAFTAQDVKKLREMTNVGMMDCKAALAATDGDMDKAVDWLREKGLAKAAKKADRIAAEGVAYATVIDGVGVVIEVNAETDFASKTPVFTGFVADVAALRGCRVDASQIPDAVPVIAAVAATAEGETVICNAERLRFKESDRIESVASMLRSLGAVVSTTPDGLIISGKPSLSGGETDSFGDHRIVMAAAVAAQKCENPVTITNAQAVGKSYPAFFEDYNSLGGKAYVL